MISQIRCRSLLPHYRQHHRHHRSLSSINFLIITRYLVVVQSLSTIMTKIHVNIHQYQSLPVCRVHQRHLKFLSHLNTWMKGHQHANRCGTKQHTTQEPSVEIAPNYALGLVSGESEWGKELVRRTGNWSWTGDNNGTVLFFLLAHHHYQPLYLRLAGNGENRKSSQ